MLLIKQKLKHVSDRKILLAFITIWFILNVIQSINTLLANDEAYYWLWSKHLAWGYYEHPSLVALFIRIGGFLNSGELGVRLVTIISSSITLYLVYIKLVKKDIWLYLAIISSIFIAHIGGFLTAPDSPLFLFTTFFYIVFKQYLTDNSKKNLFLLIVIVTAMMYSKYHAALVIVICFLSNINLIKRKSFWILTASSLILYSPHLYWLMEHGEKGLNYAFSDRFQDPLNIKNVFDYLIGQVVIFGPLLGVVFIYAALKLKSTDPFEKTLKRLIIIMFLFFLFWSFKGSVQANWTATLFIPILILSHKYIGERIKLRKVVFALWVPSLVIIFIIRLHLMFDILPLTRQQNRGNEFFGWKEYAQRVDSVAQGKPVLVGSYQSASKLWFYRNKKTIPVNNGQRINQFYEWGEYQKELVDSTVLIIQDWLYNESGKIDERGKLARYLWVKDYRSYREVNLEIDQGMPAILKPEEEVLVEIVVTPPTDWCIFGNNDTEFRPLLVYIINDQNTEEFMAWDEGAVYFDRPFCNAATLTIKVKAPKKKGNYKITFRMVTNKAMSWHSNCQQEFKVKQSNLD